MADTDDVALVAEMRLALDRMAKRVACDTHAIYEWCEFCILLITTSDSRSQQLAPPARPRGRGDPAAREQQRVVAFSPARTGR